jgi:hypothetical protein
VSLLKPTWVRCTGS